MSGAFALQDAINNSAATITNPTFRVVLVFRTPIEMEPSEILAKLAMPPGKIKEALTNKKLSATLLELANMV